MKHRIYLDHAATSPVDPEVIKAMMPYFSEYYGNASSLHSFGRDAHNALEVARGKVAALIGAQASEIIFTAGGTESDNIAIQGAASTHKARVHEHPEGPHIITSAIEHPAVVNTCRYLEAQGYKVKYLTVDKYGFIDLDELERSITKSTFLISIIYASNEIGTIEPIVEIGKIARAHNVWFHTDAVQAYGKIPINVKTENIDLLSISSHKLYGPKGVGALYIQQDVKLSPIIHGGGHERGLRSSTENIPGIVGLGKAAELAGQKIEGDMEQLTKLRDKLIHGVIDTIDEAYLNGHPTKRLPNNAHFRFTGIEGESLVLALDDEGIAASTGSACSSKKLEPSHILMAIGLNEVEAHGSLRLTLGRGNSDADIDYVLEKLPSVVSKLRKLSPLWGKRLELEKWKEKLETEARLSREVELR
jgi:cysteine desulfurase